MPLAAEPGTNTTFQLAWDLLKLDAKPGDTVIIKLAAVDLKGSRAESSPVRLKVDSAIFEAGRIAALDRQRQWSTNLATAADLTLKFHEALPADTDYRSRRFATAVKQSVGDLSHHTPFS